MKRILLAFLVLLMLASPAWALKKVLIFVPGNEYTSTGWMRLAITGLIVEGGGSYECIYMNADTTVAALGAHLKAVKNSGDYGLVVFIIVKQDADELDLTTATSGYYNYGQGKFAQFCDISRAPIGIPTVICARNGISRYSSSCRTGSTCADSWARGSIGSGADSLWVRTSVGDSILWHKIAGTSNRRHLLVTGGAPESSYPWTVDIWTKKGVGAASKVAPGQGSTMYMWHVHHTAYDAAQLPGAGQDSVIYYLPNWGTTSYYSAFDSEIKAFAALLKKYDCITDIPISLEVDDLGFSGQTSAAILAGADSFLQYCSDRQLPVSCNVQYCATDTTTFVPFMARWYSNPYVRFGWHPSTIYANAAKSSTYNIFGTWGDGATELGLVLLRDLRRDRYLLGTSGMLQYMKESDALVFNGGDYNGIANYNKTDTIFSALAAVGVRKFAIETAGFSGYKPSGNDLWTMFHPYSHYPIDLTWTGSAETVDVSMHVWWYQALASATAADTLRADPSALSDSSVVTSTIPISTLYNYSAFSRSIFTNGRVKDASSTNWTDDYVTGAWPNIYNFESRGWFWYSHPGGFRVLNAGTYYNMSLLWLKHNWNNLRAFNNIAKQDDASIGDLFKPTFLREVDQRVGPKK
jgi:hypothetical protein